MGDGAGPEPQPGSRFVLAMIAATLTAGVISLPYWARSYASIRDAGIFGSFWLVTGTLFVGTVVAFAARGRHSWIVLTTMLACLPIAVIGRVIIDTAADPTSHNLWPIELVGSFMIGIVPVCAGALVAWPIRRLTQAPGAPAA
jgi:hypothetical protein